MRIGWTGLWGAVLLCGAAQGLWAGGEAESASSASRGSYLAGHGVIVPPEEVITDSYVAYMDYGYPQPRGTLGVSLFCGHRQLAASGGEEILQIGIQGSRTPFSELPPLNLAFVVDKSGSMADAEKLDWVREAFGVLVGSLRDIDSVALVAFDDTARVLRPSARLSSPDRRLAFLAAMRRIQPGGGSDLAAGLRLGCEQVLAGFRPEHTNRVLFVTDGGGASAGLLQLADSYRRRGVTVSAIGVGLSFDVNLMVELGSRGGGSSRFISGPEEMRRVFGEELQRMAVPLARELQMTLQLGEGVELIDTWGYQHRLLEGGVGYSLPTLHQGDHETILARVRVPGSPRSGPFELARFSVEYQDLEGNRRRSGPHSLSLERVEADLPLHGVSDATVLRSSTMLGFTERLREIGALYYSCSPEIAQAQALGGTRGGSLPSPAILRLEESVRTKMRRAMALAVEMKKEVENARLRLGSEELTVELDIARKYIRILGAELKWDERAVAAAAADAELEPSVPGRGLQEQLDSLFREIGLHLRSRAAGRVALCAFATPQAHRPALLDLVDQTAAEGIARAGSLSLIEPAYVQAALAAQHLAGADLLDPRRAAAAGKALEADFLVTGAMIEMERSVVIFGRVVNVATGQVESVAQIVVRKDPQVQALLAAVRRQRMRVDIFPEIG